MRKMSLLLLTVVLAAAGSADADVPVVAPVEVGSGANHSWLHVEFDDGAIYVFGVSYDVARISVSEMVETISSETSLYYLTQHAGATLYGMSYDGHSYYDWFTGYWVLWEGGADRSSWTYSGTGWTTLMATDGQWEALVAAPGFDTHEPSPIVLAAPGDVTGDGKVDAADIDGVQAAVLAGSSDPVYDLNGDGAVDSADADHLVESVIGTRYGDANLDLSVDGGDLSLVGAKWLDSGLGWADGNFNGDGGIDGGDLALLGASWLWTSPAGTPLPEPATAALLALGAGAALRRRTRKR